MIKEMIASHFSNRSIQRLVTKIQVGTRAI